MDNYEFEIKADVDDYDIYESTKLNTKFKNILLEQEFSSKKIQPQQKDRYMNMGDSNDQKKPVIQKKNIQDDKFGKEDDLFNFDDFNNTEQNNDPFSDEQKNQVNVTSDLDQFNFNNNKKNNFKIFDDDKTSSNPFEDNNNQKLKQMNLVFDSTNHQYKVDDNNKDIEDKFYTAEDFDKQLEQQLQIQQKKTKFYRRPFEMDPEETVDSINSGFKSVFKKTKNLMGQFEEKCKVMLNKYDKSDNINQEQHQDFQNFGANIRMFENDELQQEQTQNQNIQQNKEQNLQWSKQTNDNVQNFPSNQTPFLEEYINNNTQKKKSSNSLNDFQFSNFTQNDKRVQIKQNKDQDMLEKVLSEDFLNLDQKVSTPFDQLN